MQKDLEYIKKRLDFKLSKSDLSGVKQITLDKNLTEDDKKIINDFDVMFLDKSDSSRPIGLGYESLIIFGINKLIIKYTDIQSVEVNNDSMYNKDLHNSIVDAKASVNLLIIEDLNGEVYSINVAAGGAIYTYQSLIKLGMVLNNNTVQASNRTNSR